MKAKIASKMIIAFLLLTTVVIAGCTTQTGDKTLEDGTIIKADGTMIKVDGTMVKPDGTIIKADGTMVKTDGTMIKPDGTMILPNGTMIESESEDKMMEKNSSEKAMVKYSGDVLAGSSSPVLDFNKVDYDAALKTDKLIVLYFYADWCPICRAEVPNLYAAFNELKTDNVIGFRVNFNDGSTDDNERMLARQYGIAYQHGKVFIKDGKQILKSPETWDKQRYTNEINKALA